VPRSISKLIWLNSSSLILSVSFMNGNMLNYVDGTWAKPMQVETYGQLQCHMSGFNVHAHQMDDCKLWAHIICRPDLPGSLIPPLPLLINIHRLPFTMLLDLSKICVWGKESGPNKKGFRPETYGLWVSNIDPYSGNSIKRRTVAVHSLHLNMPI